MRANAWLGQEEGTRTDPAHGGTPQTFAVAQFMVQMSDYQPVPCTRSDRSVPGSGTPEKGKILSAGERGSLGRLHRVVTSDQTPSVIFL